MNKKEADIFLEKIIREIEIKDELHSKRIQKDIILIKQIDTVQFDILLSLIYNYFKLLTISISEIVSDYLQMVTDMRHQRIYFIKNKKYSCENQKDAFEKVYSNDKIMSYYMNGLLLSQLLWKHHFNTYVFFKQQLNEFFSALDQINILDVGPGHGFYSHIVKSSIPNYNTIDLIDISEASLLMTKRMIGNECRNMNYFNEDVLNFKPTKRYDLIILGEVIEHLDNPSEILKTVSHLLTPKGILWVTTPTNAPAIDHIYLFNNKEEIIELIQNSDLQVITEKGFYSDDVSEEMARKMKVTQLICTFCRSSLTL
ncbi:MAG: methyltransferase [Paludibacter sp.]|nr:methyltransferase [Paludibacter sp.]